VDARQQWYLLVIAVCSLLSAPAHAAAPAQSDLHEHLVMPGDTWTALAWQYNLPVTEIRTLNPQINTQRQPVIGTTVMVPATEPQNGTLTRPSGPLLQTAVQHNTSPWLIAIRNNVRSPYQPALFRPLFIPGAEHPPRDLPPGFTSLAVSQLMAHPGQAIAFRAQTNETIEITATLDGREISVFRNGRSLVGLTGTGAFFGSGQPELRIQVDDHPPWSQPWQFTDPDDWTYQQLTLTGTAAEIDQASIAAERARLFTLWEQKTPSPQWQAAFQLPITNYLEISSHFGARRSYNGGPFASYHEGVDFSAYGGTAVFAAAPGTVILAEELTVRGGTVIIDHGLGIYTGYYHMSNVIATPEEVVEQGQLVGEVGTTGLSTGNHLHWDLLVNGVWVDAEAWLAQNTACWILVGFGQNCLDE
jgi:murein DD-endopeptidase MepM/ murein hydrolase activator NlpD